MAAAQMEKLFRSVHGTAPEHLIEKIVRLRIFESTFWKEHCFGLTSALLVDKAVQLTNYGGVYSENNKPTPFLCLVLKMLQLKPEMDIVKMFIDQEDAKYLRVLGAFYLRLVGSPIDIYKNLEPLYADYRKIVFQTRTGWALTHMDEFIDQLLTEDFCCDISLPHLAPRRLLESNGLLEPRQCLVKGPQVDEIDEMEYVSSSDDEGDFEKSKDGDTTVGEPDKLQNAPTALLLSEVPESRQSATVGAQAADRGSGEGGAVTGNGRQAWKEKHRRGTRSRSRDRRHRDRHKRARRSRSESRQSDRSGKGLSNDMERAKQRDRSSSRKHRKRSRSRNGRRRTSRSRSRNGRRKHRRSRSRGEDDHEIEKGKEHKSMKKKTKRKVFKGLKSTPASSTDKSKKPAGAHEENSVEYWNEMRSKLGIKPLREN